MKLALGTVQFGLAYGVANTQGQVSLPVAAEILRAAQQAGIDTLDTAIAYGNSEDCLGQMGVESFRVISKLPALPSDVADVSTWVAQHVAGSLARLKLDRLDGLMLHRPADLLGVHGRALAEALDHVVSSGQAQAVGISIYDPTELDQIWPIWQPQIIQSPLNVFDQRLISSGWLARLADAGVRVHTRSAFLQGLLLMPEAQRPAYFAPWQAVLADFTAWCRTADVSPLQACLSFAQSFAAVERVVFGVDQVEQLNQIVAAAQQPIDTDWSIWAQTDRALIEPSRWHLNT